MSVRRLPRPAPKRSPIQRACILLDAAVRAAREDERAAEFFAQVLCVTAAREAARHVDREARS